MSDKLFSVGDEAWWAKSRTEAVHEPCPTCFGSKRVTLILGNGEHVELYCEGCGKGYEGPQGFVTRYKWIAEPVLVTISKVNSELTAKGETREYQWLGSYVGPLYETEAEALAECERASAEHDKSDMSCAEQIKENTRKNYAWNASYHMRTAKEHRRLLAYHEARAVACKAKVAAAKESAK